MKVPCADKRVVAMAQRPCVQVGRIEAGRCEDRRVERGAKRQVAAETNPEGAELSGAVWSASKMRQDRVCICIVGLPRLAALERVAAVRACLVIGKHSAGLLELVIDLGHCNEKSMSGENSGHAPDRGGNLEDLGEEDDTRIAARGGWPDNVGSHGASWRGKVHEFVVDQDHVLSRIARELGETTEWDTVGEGMEMHCVRAGTGRPLLLLHGLGGSWQSWCPVLPALRRKRDVIAVDLPGFGDSPPLAGPTSIVTLADAVTGFLGAHALFGVDVAGVSMGGLLALELARRSVVGATVALAPVGFWSGWQRSYFLRSMDASVRLVRALQGAMPGICGSKVLKTAAFSQISPKPWRLPSGDLLSEMRDYGRARRFDELLHSLVRGPEQEGAASGTLRGPLTIGWGRKDRLCLPSQAKRAMELFPDAQMHWFEDCGHFPHWDQPEETVRVLLSGTGSDDRG